MKVDHASAVEPSLDQTTRTSTSAAASTSGLKISMFKGKTGFVIPKNKLSGSLVPVIKGGKKQGSNETANEENSKEVKRKTKWGADLTQDPSVRRGRVLAYQTRVDQITKLLKSISEEIEGGLDLELTTQDPDQEPSSLRDNQEKLKNLELERREAIGEVLKLNPSYKPPSDYKPLLKEAKVPIHVKKYSGYNFLGLIYGPGSATQKRLEKETGAKIQVYGTKENGKHKVHLSISDEKENQSDYEELYVLVSADTYEKVDAAVSLVELLVNPVSGKLTSAPGDDLNVPKSNDTSTLLSAPTSAVVNGVVLPPIQNPAQTQFLYNGQWLQKGPPQTFVIPPSAFVPSPNVTGPNSSDPSPFGPRPVHTANFGSIPPNSSLVPPRPPPTFQAAPNPFMPLAPPLGQNSAPSIPSPQNTSVPLSFIGGQYSGLVTSPALRPQMTSHPLPERAMNPAGSSTGWTGIQASAPSSLSQSISMAHATPSVPSQGPISPLSNSITTGTGSHVDLHFLPFIIQVLNTSFNRPTSGPVMSPHMPFQGGPNPTPSNLPYHPVTRAPIPNPSQIPSFTPLRPQHFGEPNAESNSGNFTFQPHRPQNPNPQLPFQHNNQPGMQNSFPPRPAFHTPSEPQPFPHLNAHNSAPHSVNHMFPRLQVSNQTVPSQGHLPPVPFDRNLNQISTSPRLPPFVGTGSGPGYQSSSNPIPQMGPNNFPPTNQMLNSADPFSYRPRNPMQLQHNFALPPTRPGNFSYPNPYSNSLGPGRPASGHFTGQKFYDPFSPTSVPRDPQQQQGDNSANKSRAQENDPEYEDLMASVGVK